MHLIFIFIFILLFFFFTENSVELLPSQNRKLLMCFISAAAPYFPVWIHTKIYLTDLLLVSIWVFSIFAISDL